MATSWGKISKRLRNGFSASKKISVCEVEISKHRPAAGLDINQILEFSNVGKATDPSLVIMALLSILWMTMAALVIMALSIHLPHLPLLLAQYCSARDLRKGVWHDICAMSSCVPVKLPG